MGKWRAAHEPAGRNQNDIIENVSPLRGFVTLDLPDPMAYAMGYRSFAAPRLTGRTLHEIFPRVVFVRASDYKYADSSQQENI